MGAATAHVFGGDPKAYAAATARPGLGGPSSNIGLGLGDTGDAGGMEGMGGRGTRSLRGEATALLAETAAASEKAAAVTPQPV